MKRGIMMKHEILSTIAAIALFIVLVWIYTMPFRAGDAPANHSGRNTLTEKTDISDRSSDTPTDAAQDYKQALKRNFHTLSNALFDR
jgi:hypothetical protein